MIETRGSVKTRPKPRKQRTDGGNVEKKKRVREMDALNCQFYETRVTKVNCYRYRRRQCAVYRRRALITKSPRGDKVIIEREKKRKSLTCKTNCGDWCKPERADLDAANARK